MNNAATIAAVTINWNGWSNTVTCLEALRTSESVAWHLYIVDNASTDDSLARLRDLGADVTLIASATNGGWTGGNNIGIRRALEAGHDWILIVNNDAFVAPDTLALLLQEAQAQAAGGVYPVIGPIHRGATSADYDFSVAALDPKTGIPAWAQPSDAPRERLEPTAYVSGAAMFVHRTHFETIGLFDDRFYLNFDDTDWCRRAAAAGFPLLMLHTASIRHIGSASIGGRTSPLQTYFLARNRLLYAEKHCTMRERLRLFRRYVWQARELTGSDAAVQWLPRLARARGGSLAAFRRGVIDYVMRRFGDCPSEVRRWQDDRAVTGVGL